MAKGYRTRAVSSSSKSEVLQKALNSGKKVQITSGQAKAIVTRSAQSGQYVAKDGRSASKSGQ